MSSGLHVGAETQRCLLPVSKPSSEMGGEGGSFSTLKLSGSIHPSFLLLVSRSHTHWQPSGWKKRKHISKYSCLLHTLTHTHTQGTERGRRRGLELSHLCVSRCSCQSLPRISHLSLIQKPIRVETEAHQPIGGAATFAVVPVA